MPKRKLDKSVAEDNEGEKQKAQKKPFKGHWSMSLLDSVKDPELLVKSDDLVYVVKDKYPKAQYHYLIIPKEDISSLKSVCKEHAELLKHMEEVALEITKDSDHKDKSFRIGYHAEPSMQRLHLHVISDDFNSPSLKTKKHWNSFTTDFFLKSEDVLKQLEDTGKIEIPSKATCKTYLETPLKCHKCEKLATHIPNLKSHILRHDGKKLK